MSALKKVIADALAQRGYDTLTPVQEAVSDPALSGRDLLVSAQTGSGKTLGFGLAIAPTLLGEDEVFSPAEAPLALVIAPTRELALQVRRELEWVYAGARAVLASCVGGMDMRDERRALARGAHIVVATPGRLRDHIMRGSMDMSALRAVVLDEADEMLDLGFREDLEFILGSAPDTRQTLMFSATVPAAIAKLAKNFQRDAVRVATKAEESQHADIEYRAMSVSAGDADNAIVNVLRFFEAPNAIVFCNTRAMVGRLTTRLSNRGFSVVALSGELSQSERTHALQAMRDGRARVCVATDVAARGIDLPNLDLVVHAELPSNHETLLHRSGRTGRAGRKGVSVLIAPPAARKKAQRLLGWAKLSATWGPAPSADEVMAQDEARMLDDPDWQTPVSEGEAAGVATLLDRFSAEQIAAAYLRQLRNRHSAPEELSDPEEKPGPREPFGPSTWFSLPGGHAVGAEPRRLLPMICKAGGITRDDVGAIRIQPNASFIELRQSAVDGFVKALGAGLPVEDGALTRLDTPPAIASRSGPPPRKDAKPARKGPKPERSFDGTAKTVEEKARYLPSAEPDAPAAAPAAPAEAPKPRYTPDRPYDSAAPKPRKTYKGDKPQDGPAKPYKARVKPERVDPTRDGAVSPAEPRRAPGAKPFAKGPKPSGGKPPFGKPGGKPAGKPGGKPAFGKPGGKPGGKPAGKSGGKPTGTPIGKPSSKKNRARAEAAKAGGTAPPRRNKP
jgi:ATP-dependent RNA helicase DeaD